MTASSSGRILRRPAVTCATCFCCRPADFFAIDPHDLLVPRDNPRFHDRPEIRVLEHEVGLDFLRAQQIEKSPPAGVGADRADDRDAVNELAQVARDIGRAARIKGFAGHLDHRHGRFGRDAADFAPDEFVEHQVAGYGDALAGGAGEDFPETFEFHEEECAQNNPLAMPPPKWFAPIRENWIVSRFVPGCASA